MMGLVLLSLEKADGDMGISWEYVTGSIVLFTDSRELEQYLADQRYSRDTRCRASQYTPSVPWEGLGGVGFAI